MSCDTESPPKPVENCSTQVINFNLDRAGFINNFNHQPTPAANIWLIENCPSTAAASKLISQDLFQSKLAEFPTVIAIRLKINAELSLGDVEKPKSHEFQDRKSLLIAFESIESEGHKIMIWKNVKTKSFALIDLENGFSAAAADFALNFMIEKLSEVKSAHDITQLIDARAMNLLMTAVERQKSDIFSQLLSLPFDINQRSTDGLNAADIAWKNQNHSMVCDLLKANSTFPADFKITPETESFTRTSVRMHVAIETKDLATVLEIINENHGLRYFYSTRNVSAATTALMSANFEIYGALTHRRITMGPHEDISRLLQKSYLANLCNYKGVKATEECMRKLHPAYDQSLPEKHVMVHRSNVLVSHDDLCVHHRLQLVYETLDAINAIPEGKMVLRVTAARRKFSTRLDFQRDSIEFLNPNPFSAGADGLYQFDDRVLVATKGMTEEASRADSEAIVLHELSHFALELTFANRANPYGVNDIESKKKMEEIVGKCKEIIDGDRIVKEVFEFYPASAWPRELIVRVPQMLVAYRHQPEKLKKLKETYADLFKFFNEFVMPKMDAAVNVVEKLSNGDVEIGLDGLTSDLKDAVLHSIVGFQGQDVKLQDIFTPIEASCLTSNEIRRVLHERTQLNFGSVEKIKNETYIEQKFVNFKTEMGKGSFSMEPNALEPEGLYKHVWSEDVRKNLRSFEELSGEKLVILSDQAGAGKTTTFKRLSLKLKDKFKNSWVSYVDLKRHLRIYERHEMSLRCQEAEGDQKSRAVEILKEILNINDPTESKLFINLFKSNRVILLLDGVDEIAPKFKNFFIHLIKLIRNASDVRIWIATRPPLVSELENTLECPAIKLLPFEYQEWSELIKRFLKHHGLTDQKDIDKASNEIFTSLLREDSEIYNPLLMKIMAEVYATNNNLVQNSNAYELYQSIQSIKKEILNDEKGKIANLDRDPESKMTIWEIHQVYAIILIFGSKVIAIPMPVSIEDLSIMKKWKKQRSKWSPDAICRHGFLFIDNYGTSDEFPDFVHRSFAEYFVAKYFIENVFVEDDDGDVSYEEMARRLMFFINAICSKHLDYFIDRFLRYYIEIEFGGRNRQGRNPTKVFSDHILRFFKSDEFKNLLRENHLESLICLLIYFPQDQRIMEAIFMVDEDVTTFRVYFRQGSNFLNVFPLINYIEELCKDGRLDRFTGYKPLEGIQTITLATDDEIQLTLNDFLEDSPNTLPQYCNEFLKLFSAIEQSDIPDIEIDNFISRSFGMLLTSCLRSCNFTEKVFALLTRFYSTRKSRLLQMFELDKDNPIRLKDIFFRKMNENTKSYLKRFQQIFAPEYNFFSEVFLKKQHKPDTNFFMCLVYGKVYIDFYIENFQQSDLQEIFIEYMYQCKLFLIYLHGELLDKLGELVWDIFSTDKQQRLRFLKNCRLIDQKDGHSIFSMYESEIRHYERCEERFREMAKSWSKFLDILRKLSDLPVDG